MHNKKRNFYFYSPMDKSEVVVLPYAWFLFKSYFNVNAQQEIKNIWNWVEPISEMSLENVMETLSLNPPDVFAVSTYLWNAEICHEVAEKVKARWPECIVVLGGPQQDTSYNREFFVRHPYVDVVCAPEGYGEVFVHDLLTQISLFKLDYKNLPFAIYPDGEGGYEKSSVVFSYKNYMWQKGLFSLNREFILFKKNAATLENRHLYSVFETSRGCPYSCSFCEWGGAISKVSFKPLDIILEDIESLAQLGIEYLQIADANFGIVERDVAIAEKIVEVSKVYGYPKSIGLCGISKNQKKYSNKIIELFVKEGLLPELKLSVQDFDADILPKINRTDRPWREQLDVARAIVKECPVEIRFELILGLPGSSIESFKQSLSIEYEERIRTVRYLWLLLSDTPANAPAYRSKYELKTRKLNVLKEGLGENFHFWALKNQPPPEQKYNVVVQTSSYSMDDWKKKFLTMQMKESGRLTQFLEPILIYERLKGAPIGNLLWDLYNEFFCNPQAKFFPWIKHLDETTSYAMENEGNIEMISTPFPSPYLLRIDAYFVVMFSLYKSEIYYNLKTWLQKRFGFDYVRNSLIDFLTQAIMTCAETPVGKEFRSDYDWNSWIKSNFSIPILDEPLVYTIAGTDFGPYKEGISWSHLTPAQKLPFTFRFLSFTNASHLAQNLTVKKLDKKRLSSGPELPR